MLLLTRRIGENILIGKDGEIKINVRAIKQNQVMIGIEAPKDIPVHREEIFKKIKEQQDDPK